MACGADARHGASPTHHPGGHTARWPSCFPTAPPIAAASRPSMAPMGVACAAGQAPAVTSRATDFQAPALYISFMWKSRPPPTASPLF